MKLIDKLNKLENVEDMEGKIIKKVLAENTHDFIVIVFTDNSIICLNPDCYEDSDSIEVDYRDLANRLHDDFLDGLCNSISDYKENNCYNILADFLDNGLISLKDVQERIAELELKSSEFQKKKVNLEYAEYLRLKEKYENR